jgi:hypothetical protein
MVKDKKQSISVVRYTLHFEWTCENCGYWNKSEHSSRFIDDDMEIELECQSCESCFDFTVIY